MRAARALSTAWVALGLGLALGVPAQDRAGGAGQDARARRDWRIGVFFWHASPNDAVAFDGIRAALEECGQDAEPIVRRAGADPERGRAMLKELRGERLDVLFAMGTEAALFAKEAIDDLPIVFTAVTNPVESGVVPSWQGSGRNLAGNSNWIASDVVLQAFRLAVPKLSRLGILRSEGAGVVSGAELRAMRSHVAEPDAPPIEIVEALVDEPDSIAGAVATLIEAGVEAIWIPIDIAVYQNMPRVLAAVEPHGVPLVSSSLRGTTSGAVAGVVVDYAMLGERAVSIAQDILEHSRAPGSIPVGTMQGYRVVVNIEAARRTGYELPLSLLVLADRILENLDDGGATDGRK